MSQQRGYRIRLLVREFTQRPNNILEVVEYEQSKRKGSGKKSGITEVNN